MIFGDKQAPFDLGVMFLKGDGVKKDMDIAAIMLELAKLCQDYRADQYHDTLGKKDFQKKAQDLMSVMKKNSGQTDQLVLETCKQDMELAFHKDAESYSFGKKLEQFNIEDLYETEPTGCCSCCCEIM
jgi:hypothetical protein